MNSIRVVLSILVLSLSAYAKTYYVATAGSDSNPGSVSAPLRTIQRAANLAVAGDIVLVHGGVYYEHVNIPASGSSSAGYIVFQNYPGETPIVDGTGLSIPNGQFGMFTIHNQSYIRIQGFLIRNYNSRSAGAVPLGVYVWGAGSHIDILNNRITNISNTAYASDCNGSSNPNAFGIAVYGTSAPASINNLTIDGNQVDHLKTGCSESLSINGNVQYWAVTNNTIHDNNNIGIDAIGYEGSAPLGSLCGTDLCDRARDGSIIANTVYNISSFSNPVYAGSYSADGIYVDGGTRIVIDRNRIYRTDIGIELASENPGNETPGKEVTSYVTVRNNLVYFSNSVGLSLGGYDITRGGTTACTIVNNTLFHNDLQNTGSGELQVQYFATNNKFYNNILFATTQALVINSFSTSKTAPFTSDNNLFFATGGIAGTFIWHNQSYTGLPRFASVSGGDYHSLSVDPRFVDLSLPNLTLQSSSLARNAGINLSPSVNGTLDFAGNPRTKGSLIDIGAYEN